MMDTIKVRGIIDGKDIGFIADINIPKELTVKEQIEQMEQEAKSIRKALVKNELDYGIRKGLYDELVEAGLADEHIYKFAAVLGGWHV